MSKLFELDQQGKMSLNINDIIDNPNSQLLPETKKWLQQISTPSQAFEELVAKISVLEEELEISQEQVQTLNQELNAEQQKVAHYQEELKACHQDMAALNQELHNYYSDGLKN
jgi:chromosome segregation ATPase